jgi:hypothetical protein
MRRLLRVPILIALVARSATGQGAIAPGLTLDDRVRLAEAFRLAETLGDSIWPGWSRVPLATLFITSDREDLIRHPQPSSDFTKAGYDSLLGSEVYTRPRVFEPNLLATFPAVSGVPTIVIGTPAATSRPTTRWMLTLLHEHFHQLQMSRPDYGTGVNALNLARGDRGGMWMLNYAFPYDSAAVQAQYSAFAADLLRVFDSPKDAAAALPALTASRARLRAALPADDDRYLGFQMWQEGVSRYVELTAARRAAASFTPSPAFAALSDYTTLRDAVASMESEIRSSLQNNPLGRLHRVAFYAAGAAYAQALHAASPDWVSTYWTSGYQLGAKP